MRALPTPCSCSPCYLSRIHFPASLPSAWLYYSPLDHGIRLATQSALGHLRYYEGSDSCHRSPPTTGLPAYLTTTSQRSASNHAMCPGIALHANSAYRASFGLRLERAGSSSHPAESSSSSCGPPVRFRLLPTPPRGDAVAFGYGALAYPDTDFHRAVVAPSRAHSFPRKRESSVVRRKVTGSPPSRERVRP